MNPRPKDTNAEHPLRLPLGATIIPAPREPPSKDLVATLARAGLSDAALDAAGGKGTARSLRREREKHDQRLDRRMWRMKHAQRIATTFLVVGLIFAALGAFTNFGLFVVVGIVIFVGAALAVWAYMLRNRP